LVKLLPTAGDSLNSGIEESGEDYLRLLAAARRTAEQIVTTPREGLTGAASYIHRCSEELLARVPDRGDDFPSSDHAIFDCLRRLVAVWPDIAGRKIIGEQVFSGDPGLWKRAMTEWPMGGFARMAADFMIANDLLSGHLIELGAGVGSCSALVAGHVTDRFIRTDLQPFLLKRQKIAGTVERYDFNEPGRWHDVDLIFAVNALHCARDKLATLGHLFNMLRSGGVLVLGEGRPYTDDNGTPWALNPFFGLFRGWWDVSGFIAREDWVAMLGQAGFSRTGYAARRAGSHDLGGVIWAVK
jgi:SAM-dependent methyltransferase